MSQRRGSVKIRDEKKRFLEEVSLSSSLSALRGRHSGASHLLHVVLYKIANHNIMLFRDLGRIFGFLWMVLLSMLFVPSCAFSFQQPRFPEQHQLAQAGLIPERTANAPTSRRSVLSQVITVASTGTAVLTTNPSLASAVAIEGRGGATSPIEEIGGGLDVREISPKMRAATDVLYPPSIQGIWETQRMVTNAEGNIEQAKIVWSLLAGGKDPNGFRQAERFQSKFLLSEQQGTACILDRGFEMSSRSMGVASNIEWDSVILSYVKQPQQGSKQTELAVVDRKLESPSDEGFGFNELVRITSPGSLPRVARVKRRYRRAFDPESGDRVIEGLEIVRTYRVLDGVAGIEMPTSTTKSQIRMKRPKA